MKNKRYLILFTLLLSTSLLSTAQPEADNLIRTHRLSERVLILTEDSPMENNIVALASEKGLVVIDTTGSPYTASLVRKIIEKEFERSDFLLVINTHHHWDHAWGNQVFPDAEVIGHELCLSLLAPNSSTLSQMTTSAQSRMNSLRKQLKNLATESEEAAELRKQAAFQERIYKGLSSGFTAVTPVFSFSDRMTLDLGDLTIKMIYFGRAHSGSDIFIQVPEEKLLVTGDLFLDIGWLPLFAGSGELDIPRWIETLSSTLDGEDEVVHVIPGHRKIWTRDKLNMWRDYIVNLWEGVQMARSEGLGLEEAIDRFPLEEKYYYLKDLGHTDSDLTQFQRRNIQAFLRQLIPEAATKIEQTIDESGIEAGIRKYHELKKKNGSYSFDENSFNSLGYRLMAQGKIKEAIAVFELNVEAYPRSWNVFDSLGEAYMNDGQTELAVKMYQKSLELNPQNSNAVEMLKRFKK